MGPYFLDRWNIFRLGTTHAPQYTYTYLHPTSTDKLLSIIFYNHIQLNINKIVIKIFETSKFQKSQTNRNRVGTYIYIYMYLHTDKRKIFLFRHEIKLCKQIRHRKYKIIIFLNLCTVKISNTRLLYEFNEIL